MSRNQRMPRLAKINQMKLEEMLIYFNTSPEKVMKELSNRLETLDKEIIASNIELLSVLIHFEKVLWSHCERDLKKNVLLSLGDLIRFLGSSRISPICFKIVNLLKASNQNLSEFYITVWDIFIRTVNVVSLGPVLSIICVSLETFIDNFPEEVNGIFKYLLEENVNLLSMHINDLFFIGKTRIDNDIKKIVLNMIESQDHQKRNSFKASLESLMCHMRNEISDVKIRIYTIQCITELFQSNRKSLNEMICGQMKMNPIFEDLQHILISNCKSTSSALRLATSECLGELGAIKTSLQKKIYLSQQKFPNTILCHEFAILALKHLCQSYQYTNNWKHIDALSLGIQGLLRANQVTLENRQEHVVWLSIPEKMRPLLEHLFSSKYAPVLQTIATEKRPIFLNHAYTTSGWVQTWAKILIAKIPLGLTRWLLDSLKPSMTNNQYTTSTFLPYVFLHYLQLSDVAEHPLEDVVQEIQYIFYMAMEIDKSCDYKKLAMVTNDIVNLIFEVFDFLNNFRRTNEENQMVTKFLDCFDMMKMAEINYNCGEHARATPT